MKLSDYKDIGSLKIIQDGEFFSLGTINHKKPGMLSYLESAEYLLEVLGNLEISCIITTGELISHISVDYPLGIAVSDNPKKSFFDIHNYLARNTDFYSREFLTTIGKSSIVHPTAFVSPSNVTIGEGCTIGPHVTILEGTTIEDNVIIRAGTVIGTEGFEFKRFHDEIFPVIHAGGVYIHNNVEIQSNCCVCKGIFGDNTEIGEYSKLDNLIHVAHGVKIGKRCLIPASVMIGGSVTIGDNVWIGPGSSVSNGLQVGDNAFVTLGSVVTKNVLPNQRVTGNFAIDHQKFLQFLRTIR